ncbi:MAG TPA: TatD family hydrolase [Candidatus Binataceae bacterium]|nr:TatD family hydrolase [Candidatus Binataceae bacterium]
MIFSVPDSHCHLADPRLREDVEAVIARARAAGVETIISVGAIGTIETDRRTVEIAERNDSVYAVIGVHPHDAKDCDAARLDELRDLARSRRVVAIGESGLDFHYLHSPHEAQEAALRRHLELAAELGQPIVIHCRDAETRVREIVEEVGIPPRGGVIHCFTGDTEAARRFLALGFHISFSGIVTFRNAATSRIAATVVPDDRIMIETDAPYLAPEPYRGKRNEPAFVMRTLEVLAGLRGVDSAALAAIITTNVARLFLAT